MSLIHVEFDWSDEYGPCIECSLPAAYNVPDLYGPTGPHDNRMCSRCAALAASNGERIVWLHEERH